MHSARNKILFCCRRNKNRLIPGCLELIFGKFHCSVYSAFEQGIGRAVFSDGIAEYDDKILVVCRFVTHGEKLKGYKADHDADYISEYSREKRGNGCVENENQMISGIIYFHYNIEIDVVPAEGHKHRCGNEEQSHNGSE